MSGSADQLPVPAGSSIGKESKKHKKGKKKKKKRKKNKKNKNGNDGSGSSSSDSEAEVDVTSMVNFIFLRLYTAKWLRLNHYGYVFELVLMNFKISYGI